jgi:hypothetical protein
MPSNHNQQQPPLPTSTTETSKHQEIPVEYQENREYFQCLGSFLLKFHGKND